MTNMIALFFGL